MKRIEAGKEMTWKEKGWLEMFCGQMATRGRSLREGKGRKFHYDVITPWTMWTYVFLERIKEIFGWFYMFLDVKLMKYPN